VKFRGKERTSDSRPGGGCEEKKKKKKGTTSLENRKAHAQKTEKFGRGKKGEGKKIAPSSIRKRKTPT